MLDTSRFVSEELYERLFLRQNETQTNEQVAMLTSRLEGSTRSRTHIDANDRGMLPLVSTSIRHNEEDFQSNEEASTQVWPLTVNKFETRDVNIDKKLPMICDSNCKCNCHRINLFTSPCAWRLTLGQLCLGIQSSPVPVARCSSRACRNGSSGFFIYHWFPKWLTGTVIILSAAMAPNKGLELNVRILRERGDSGAFLAMNASNYCRCCSRKVKRAFLVDKMLECGQASALDVDQCGRNLIQVELRSSGLIR